MGSSPSKTSNIEHLRAEACQDDGMSDDLVLVEGNMEQWAAVVGTSFTHWASGMTNATDYVARCRLQIETDFSRNRGTFRVLVPKSCPGSLDVLCSCETYEFKLLMSPAGHVGPAQIGRAVSLNTLFTPSGKRSKGYAHSLIRLLARELLAETNPRVDMIWGHSAVGDAYTPWAETFPSVEVVVDTESEDAKRLVSASLTEDWVSVREQDIEPLVQADAESLVHELDTSLSGANPRTRFALLPEIDILMWRVERTKFTLQKSPGRSIEVWGAAMKPTRREKERQAEHGSRESTPPAYCVWHPDTYNNQLRLNRLRASTPQEFQALLGAAVIEARNWDLKEVACWNVDENLLVGTGFRKEDRGEDSDTSVARFLWQDVRPWNSSWMVDERFFSSGFRG